MGLENDIYKTLVHSSGEVLFKDRNSKFYGYAFPVENESEIKNQLESIKKRHHSARHYCYAWQLGVNNPAYRVNDDGEPSNSAGMPIYGQIQSFGITNALLVVVRYFGGIKLGVGGLINAYKTTAQMTLANAQIVERTINIDFKISFEYEHMDKVMRIIKEKALEIKSQKMEMNGEIIIAIRKKNATDILNTFTSLYPVIIEKV
ncbi:YigZ family protein [Leptobacterium sp. I13]|uniref:IMPACT family protein n=1 Tax=Leptobacterium meishanense TaxID=3128904 RepID=UPI0030ED01DB